MGLTGMKMMLAGPPSFPQALPWGLLPHLPSFQRLLTPTGSWALLTFKRERWIESVLHHISDCFGQLPPFSQNWERFFTSKNSADGTGLTWIIQDALLILDWSKSSFKFFCNILWGKPTGTFLPTQYEVQLISTLNFICNLNYALPCK